MALAVVMVLLQLGFLEAVRITAAINYDQLDFDIALVSTQFQQFYWPGRFPAARLVQARCVPGVTAARPLYARMGFWRCPPGPTALMQRSAEHDGSAPPLHHRRNSWWKRAERGDFERRALLVLAIDPQRVPFRDPIRRQIAEAGPAWKDADRLLFNDRSNSDFGWTNWPSFKEWELGSRHVEITSPFSLTRSFGADASVLCSDTNFARAFGLATLEDATNFGLIRVAPGHDAEGVCAQLARTLPRDIRVLSRPAIYRLESDYWVRQTATGKIFSFGVFLTMVVAAAVVCEVLSSDIRDHLAEYATLKAMGYSDSFLAFVIALQAGLYAVACFIPSIIISLGTYRITDHFAHIPMSLTARNVLIAFVVTALSSQVAGALSARKLRQADPAELYR
jgi:putative ABC transport system permease protein